VASFGGLPRATVVGTIEDIGTKAGEGADVGVFDILLFLVMAAVVVFLVAGLVTFARGGEQDSARQNMLMRLRVGAQAAAIVLLALMVYFSRS
jgi:cytochrome b subunit of formate dehydrogenase